MLVNQFLLLGAVLFCIGVYGVVARRNGVLTLMSIELILNAVNINLVVFGALTVVTGSAVVLEAPADPVALPGGGTATFEWTLDATGAGALRLAAAVDGIDANDGATRFAVAESNAATVADVTELAVNPFGDGHAAARSVAAIAALFGEGQRLPDFDPHQTSHDLGDPA